MSSMNNVIRPLDRDTLRDQFRSATPFPWIEIPNFLEPDFLERVVEAYPTFDRAWADAGDDVDSPKGRGFNSLNERFKVQITDASSFPDPVAQLDRALASPQFLADLEYITGIPKLRADDELVGAGMHITGKGGRLDVHIDFNYEKRRDLHRRLNILLYLNPVWEPTWGGQIELWDRQVRRCHHSFLPNLNRCILFETSEISFHGVQPVTCPDDVARKSFAAYYYTREAPEGWDGTRHTTVFRARPTEFLRGTVLMPLHDYRQQVRAQVGRAKKVLKRALGWDR